MIQSSFNADFLIATETSEETLRGFVPQVREYLEGTAQRFREHQTYFPSIDYNENIRSPRLNLFYKMREAESFLKGDLTLKKPADLVESLQNAYAQYAELHANLPVKAEMVEKPDSVPA